MARSGGSSIHAVGCAKDLGLAGLGILEEQKEGHMAGVLRPRGSMEEMRAET